jgi:hypothetical protein
METISSQKTDLKILRGKNGVILNAVMNAIIPRGGAYAPGAADRDLLPRADEMLVRYDPSIRALFPLMLRYIQYSAFLSKGRVFTRLDEIKGAEFLTSMEESPFFYRRTIILLMKLVTMLAFYEDDDMSRLTGYIHGCHMK